MKDRVSTEVLPNGAIRYGIYDAAGTLLRYEYIKPEDNPTQEGDAINKANLLPDDVAELLGVNALSNPQVKDALSSLALGPGRYGYSLTFTYSNGFPVQNKLVSGLVSLLDAPVYTDSSGKAFGVSESLSPTVSIAFADYLDVASFSKQLEGAFPVASHEITVPLKSVLSITITSSRVFKFSEATATFSGTVLGGGGGGSSASNGDDHGAGGAGGYYNTFAVASPNYNIPYTCTIGAQGAAGQLSINNGAGGTGGGTSISGVVSVSGGGGGQANSQGYVRVGGVGNGNGGNGGQGYGSAFGGNGVAGTGGVGGGGGGGIDLTYHGRGANGGGDGGYANSFPLESTPPSNGTYGCGGGGGFVGANSGNGAYGGPGKVTLAWVLK